LSSVGRIAALGDFSAPKNAVANINMAPIRGKQ